MSKEARSRIYGLTAVAFMMLLSYQNCGQSANSGQANLPTDGTVHIAPSQADPAEQAVLSQVLTSYSSCNQLNDSNARSNCELAALQNGSNSASTSTTTARATTSSTGPSTVTPTVTSKVCYIVGPKCLVPDADGSYNSLMRLQACRMALVNSGNYTYDSLNSFMSSDPINYAQQVNSQCLYRDSQCVVAVRCVSANSLPGAAVND